ncbi:MAG: ECF transporter S component [Oscillospiraceae bacterium]|nr:ECF transporter S component [Oscillospiraceae bacterium]
MSKKFTVHKIAFIAILTALVFVVTFYRFPLMGSKVHFANAVCLLSGLLLGPLGGGLAAGLGSMLYDVFFYPSDLITYLITFISKFAMAWVCGKIAFAADKEARNHGWNIVACVVGAWTYVALYMLKTFIYQKFVYGYPAETVWAALLSKFPASAINAVFAMIVAPILYTALRPALQKARLLDKIRL